MVENAAGAIQTATTLNDRMNGVKATKTFYRLFALTSAGVFIDTMDVYLASGTIGYLKSTGFSTDLLNSTFLSSGFLGLFLGSLLAGVIGDRKGRMTAFQWNLLIFGLATLVGAFSPNMWFLIVMRFISGIGLGAELVTSFSVINEFAPVSSRGRWGTLVNCIGNIGAPVAMALCLLLIPHFTWRSTYFLNGVMALIVCYFRHHLPESPRWNIAHGNFQAADQVITQIETEMTAAGLQPASVTQQKTLAKASDNHLVRYMLVAIMLAVGTQVCQYTFTSWVPTLLVAKGITIVSSLSYTTVMMLGAPVGAFIGSLLVDRVGRRKNIIGGFILVMILGFTYTLQSKAAMVMFVGFLLTCCFYVLNSTIIGVYVTELFSTKYRFRGAGVANGLSKFANFGMPYLVIWILQIANEDAVIYFIIGLAAVSAIVTFIWGPETKAKKIN